MNADTTTEDTTRKAEGGESAGRDVVYEATPGWAGWPIHVSFAALVFIAGVFSEKEGVGFVLVVFALLVLGYVYLIRSKNQYLVTPTVVVARRGIVRRSIREVPLDEITGISVEQSVLGRLVGEGDVRVQSGSMSGTLTLENVPNPDRFVDAIQTQQH